MKTGMRNLKSGNSASWMGITRLGKEMRRGKHWKRNRTFWIELYSLLRLKRKWKFLNFPAPLFLVSPCLWNLLLPWPCSFLGQVLLWSRLHARQYIGTWRKGLSGRLLSNPSYISAKPRNEIIFCRLREEFIPKKGKKKLGMITWKIK